MFFPPVACLQEFEVIAQIKLLQLASNNYSFTQDSHFREWFAGVEKLSEAERSVRSLLCIINNLLSVVQGCNCSVVIKL